MERNMRLKPKCCVPNCEDRTCKRHRFPNPEKYPTLFKLWVEKVNNSILKNKTPQQIRKTYLVCDRHFPENYKTEGRKGIWDTAYPSLFLPDESNDVLEMQECTNVPEIHEGNNDLMIGEPAGCSNSIHLLRRGAVKKRVMMNIHEKNLLKRLTYQNRRIQKMSDEISLFKNRLRCAQKLNSSLNLNKILKYVSQCTINFIQSQLRNQRLQPRGWRFFSYLYFFKFNIHIQRSRVNVVLSSTSR
ncbi:uncharacterized protein LOC123310335 [Coccinella septempunctata]|uniref:uncharacterized protein LOC123310335 n=1 Tax=Coccinella septempunctata TaxID=41139 RepID=UPI001D05F46A|nr:uncharacterized protein LOC123310335 [Coccinella septempunctata]